MGISSGLKTGARGVIPLVRKIFTLNFFAIVLALILIYSIVVSIQKSSLEPLVTGIGGYAASSLNELNDQSLRVLDEGYEDLGKWSKFKIFLSVFGSLMFIILWIKVLASFVAKSIFSGDTSRWLANWSVAVMMFIFLQVIFILFVGSTGAFGENYSAIDALTLPWDALRNFFTAIPPLLEPILHFWELFQGSPELPNNLSNPT